MPRHCGNILLPFMKSMTCACVEGKGQKRDPSIAGPTPRRLRVWGCRQAPTLFSLMSCSILGSTGSAIRTAGARFTTRARAGSCSAAAAWRRQEVRRSARMARDDGGGCKQGRERARREVIR